MSRNDVVDVQHCGAAIQCLPPEYAAEGTVVLPPDLGHYGIHCPSIELVVREDLQWHVVLLLIPFYSLQQMLMSDRAGLAQIQVMYLERVISIPCNSFVYGKQEEVRAVFISFV